MERRHSLQARKLWVAEKGAKGRETCPFCALDGFNEIRLTALKRNGGDDETRTRDLCRDSETALGFTGTYKLRRPPKSLQNVPNFESCGSGVDRDFFVFVASQRS